MIPYWSNARSNSEQLTVAMPQGWMTGHTCPPPSSCLQPEGGREGEWREGAGGREEGGGGREEGRGEGEGGGRGGRGKGREGGREWQEPGREREVGRARWWQKRKILTNLAVTCTTPKVVWVNGSGVNAEIIRVITTGSRKPLSNSTSTRNVTR